MSNEINNSSHYFLSFKFFDDEGRSRLVDGSVYAVQLFERRGPLRRPAVSRLPAEGSPTAAEQAAQNGQRRPLEILLRSLEIE